MNGLKLAALGLVALVSVPVSASSIEPKSASQYGELMANCYEMSRIAGKRKALQADFINRAYEAFEGGDNPDLLIGYHAGKIAGLIAVTASNDKTATEAELAEFLFVSGGCLEAYAEEIPKP